jgi:hypothetical protein
MEQWRCRRPDHRFDLLEKDMTVTKLLTLTAAVLLATLVAQLSPGSHAQPPRSRPTSGAVWRFDPKSFIEAAKLPDLIVRGEVIEVTPNAPHLRTIMPIPGEKWPGEMEQDVIEYDAVSLQVTDVTKPGSSSFSLQTDRTQCGSLGVPGPGGVQPLVVPLEDDPSYVKGEEYFLFLLECDLFRHPEQRWMVIGAKGRFRVFNGRVEPMVPRGRSGWIDELFYNQDGKPRMDPTEFEVRIRTARAS